MQGPKPPVVNLSPAEQQALEQLVNAHSTAQQIALRARIILTVSQGLNMSRFAARCRSALTWSGSGAAAGWLGKRSR